jgi:hypothetical protein
VKWFAAAVTVLGVFFATAAVPSPLLEFLRQRWGFPTGLLTLAFAVYALSLDLMPAMEIDMEVARHYHDVRCFGILVMAKHAAARIRPGGSIVLTSGIAGARPSPGWAVASGTQARSRRTPVLSRWNWRRCG